MVGDNLDTENELEIGVYEGEEYRHVFLTKENIENLYNHLGKVLNK